jgi:diketogulonate reductase-like aldo/keto reductase
MRVKTFGVTGVELPVIGQGTWDMPESGARLDEAKRALHRGVDLGMTHLDTAEMYGAGRVEELLGEAIARLPRERLFITSKVLPSNATYQGTLRACERSLRRLRLEYLDCYLLHWPGEHPLEETMRALERLVNDGKTRFVGVSNFDVAEMVQAQPYLNDVPLACNQVLYHLGERGIEHRLVPLARERGIAVIGYTPFGRWHFARDATAMAVLERIARNRCATVRQVILAFLTREPNVFAIPKAARIAHVEENAAAGDLALERDEIDAIDGAFPARAPGPLATL